MTKKHGIIILKFNIEIETFNCHAQSLERTKHKKSKLTTEWSISSQNLQKRE